MLMAGKSIRVSCTPLMAVMLATGGILWMQGCSWFRVNLISVDEEKDLGAQLSHDVEKEIELVEDEELNAYVASIGNRIVRSLTAEERQFNYTFKVVNSADVNAFALPGGYIYVNMGLLCFARNEAELAGVVAHEVAHVVRRHGTERLTQAFGAQILAEAVLGNNPSIWSQIVAQAVATAGFLNYSRSQEEEADQIGVVVMHRAGWNPEGLVEFFQLLLKAQGEAPEGVLGVLNKWLSSHPLTEDRVENTQQIIAEENLAGGTMDSPVFNTIKGQFCRSIQRQAEQPQDKPD